MGTGELQGWYADPFRLHEARYFSAGQPTALVRDGGTESYDEPPAGGWDPAAGTATTAAPMSAPMSAPSAAAAPGPGGPGAAWPQGAARDAYQYSAAAIRGRRRSRSGAFAGVTLLVAAAVIGVLITNQPQSLSPVAFVRQSAQRTLAQHTADMTLSMKVQFDGLNETLYGSGELNFSTDAMAIDVTGGPSGQPFDIKEILVNGTLYIAFSIDGQSPLGPGGPTWSQLTVPTSGSGSYSDGDPYTMLSQIEREGGTLRPLGTKVIGG